MAKCTKKIGITSKHRTSHGASLRKIEISQHAKYTCFLCSKTKVKTGVVGIRHCGFCMKTGWWCWTHNTTSAITVKSAISRLKDQEKLHNLKHC
ncbi:PREDICTED: 60S ribosomal protein L37a-like [Myotis davidii]|uniref:60S ribosomal protein L37a-like n=1 Tax=Myotis davidii TaxID=225400 RepID=UPI000766F0AF|nr:PREDICTED: 60S ribosomal protein L37a-like [Myotis davidii]